MRPASRSTGAAQVDRLTEESHKKAARISKRLKYNVREAIEIPGNEAVWYLREVRHEKVYGIIEADKLSSECLRYLYACCSFSMSRLAHSSGTPP